MRAVADEREVEYKLAHLIDFREYFAPELAQLETMQQQGLVTLDEGSVKVTALG